MSVEYWKILLDRVSSEMNAELIVQSQTENNALFVCGDLLQAC